MIHFIISKMSRPIKIYLKYKINSEGLDWLSYKDWYMNHSLRLTQFKDIHRGKGCFLIGNGPSLNKMDLRPLTDYYSFGLNKIYLIFDKVKLNLSYHVAINPLVIEQSLEQFRSLGCPSFLSYKPARQAKDMADNFYYIKTLQTEPASFQTEITKGVDEGSTVTYAALQVAFYMGFERVFLIGVDHNFKVSGNPHEQQFLTEKDSNHFDSRYFQNQEWQLPDLEGSEISYKIADFIFNRNRRKILDATVDGKLQVFNKISFKEALEMCGKKHD